jgi:hypothetical protein
MKNAAKAKKMLGNVWKCTGHKIFLSFFATAFVQNVFYCDKYLVILKGLYLDRHTHKANKHVLYKPFFVNVPNTNI